MFGSKLEHQIWIIFPSENETQHSGGKFGEETWTIESSGGLQLQLAAFVFVGKLEISFCRMGQWLSYVSIWHFLHKGNCWCCIWYFFSCLPFTLHVITWWRQVGLAFFQPFLSSDAKLRTLRMPLGLFKHTIRDDTFNPLTAVWALRALIDFMLFNARRFTRQWGNPWQGKGPH